MKMREELYTFKWKEFLPGEMVSPTSTRCSLEPGVYKVVAFTPPFVPFEQDGIVFVEGHIYGISAEYLRLAQERDKYTQRWEQVVESILE